VKVVIPFALVAAAILTGCGSNDPRLPAGPLAASVSGSAGEGVPIDPHTHVSFGLALVNRSDKRLVLDRVALLGKAGTIAIVGVGVAHQPKTGIGSALGFPPREIGVALRPVKGAVIEPHGIRDDLLIGLAMRDKGVGRFTAIKVDYHSGADRYSAQLSYSLELCAPSARWAKPGCPIPES
jgi:hypothetical protein